MDLFVVNRYTGEDAGEKEADEQKKLSKIMKNIEKRKKSHEKRTLERRKGKVQKFNTEGKKLKKQKKFQISADISTEDKKTTVTKNDAVADIDNITETVTNDDTQVEDTESFTILGTNKFDKKAKVKRVLPKWLLHPTVISGNLQSNLVKVEDVEDLDIDLKNKLIKYGIKKFFPVQFNVIPFLIKSATYGKLLIPQDICVSAPTGSGKTLAFILPILQTLKNRSTRKIRALVILPTQSLAVQIYQTFKLYAQETGIHIGIATGRCTFEDEQKQIINFNSVWGYSSNVDILVCTAGRLVDHLKSTKGFSLRNLEYLVIDEADRVLDNVQDDWLYHLENHLKYEDMNDDTDTAEYNKKVTILNVMSIRKKRPPQKLLFSATLSQDPEKLQKLSLFQPKLFTSVILDEEDSDHENNKIISNENFIGKYTMPVELTEKYIVCSLDVKPLVLYKYIKDCSLKKVMVFTNTVKNGHRLKLLLRHLAPDMTIEEISSSFSLQKRTKLMQSFAEGHVDVLVCTDSMARGVDLPSVNCVISYSAPIHVKTYIHRVGRTARAGEKGLAVTLLQPTQKDIFLRMMKQVHKTKMEKVEINTDEITELTLKYQEALTGLKNRIEKETESSKLKIKKEKGLLRNKMKRKRVKDENKKSVKII